MTVQDILALINAVAPFETMEEWDNCGLLVGSSRREVSGILFALDVTEPVIDEAVRLGASLIITHHPLMFSPVRRITDEDYEGRLISRMLENRLSLIAAMFREMTFSVRAPCPLRSVRGIMRTAWPESFPPLSGYTARQTGC